MEFSALSPVTAGSAKNSWSNGFSLNEFEVYPASGEVKTAQAVQSLEPKVMQVLLHLVNSAGEVLSAEQLFSLVWPRSVYSPVSVRRAVNQLRKVFADDSKTIFKTYPKRGYALHARLSPLAPGPAAETADNTHVLQSTAAATATGRSTFYSEATLHSTLSSRPRMRFPGTRIGYLLILLLAFCAALLLLNSTPAPTWQVTSLQPLTATAEQETFSRFTPDNSAVVYLSHPDKTSGASELWLTSTDRLQQRLLYKTDFRIDFFSWLPSAPADSQQRLLLAARTDDNLQFFSLTLSADYQLLAYQDHLGIPNGRINSPFYSDGIWVFYLANEHNTQKLYRANLNSGQIDLLLSASQQFSPYRIAPSPAPSAITLLGFDDQQRSQLKQLIVSSGEISDIATLDANWYFIDYQPSFAGYLLSDGKSLFTLDAQQKLHKLPFENYAFLHYPTLAANGKALSYTHATASGNIYLQPLNTQAPIALTSGTAHSWRGSFSHDNRQLAYVSNKYGHSQIFVLNIATGKEQLVYDNAQQHLALSQPLWSADNTKLAFARNQRLVIVDLSTAQTEHFDQIIGLPTQWLDNNDELLIRQSAKPINRWYRFSLDRPEQQAVIASELAQVIHNDTRYVITETQLQTASGTVLFATADTQYIARHFAKTNGLYLMLASPATAEAEVWLYTYTTGQAEKITTMTLPSTEISDINQQQLLYSTFATEKDIHTLTLKRLMTQ
ncbi:winged helix-turn-helix domain-containing protein [Rheinheimera muenzenbergensis]|uniref:Winged helix-turn-helix domain-containing protein n=1 Tax=Rheinheimera muenzenbergensis TaxID=1193628 RepID=A0ABU8CC21_9GAMM